MARILVVDDNPEIVELLQLVLEGAGHNVVCASSGKEGLAMAKENNPELIVLDVMMETASKGIEVARELKKDQRLMNIPIVMLTAVKEKMGIGFKEEAGDQAWLPVDDYCEKPVNPEILLKKVNNLLQTPV